MGCVLPNTDFYFSILVKTVGPLVVVGLLWLYPTLYVVTRTPRGHATQFATEYSLYLFEILLPSVSTTLSQALVCDRFENGWFLRAQLTLPCDDSPRRRHWVVWTSVAIVAYPICVPFFLFLVMYYFSPKIKASLLYRYRFDGALTFSMLLTRLV